MDGVRKTINESRKKFDEMNETDSLYRALSQNEDMLVMCTNRRDLRRKNALLRENDRIRHEIERRVKKKSLFNTLITDVEGAEEITRAGRVVSSEPVVPASDIEDVRLALEDVFLIDNGERLQDAREQLDDICTNCGMQMERCVQMSYLVCPNLDCGHVRMYVDTSSAGTSTYTARSELAKGAPRKVTHYNTYLNMAQGKTTKDLSYDFLMRVAHFCYVEGARSEKDINRVVLNKAQKHIFTDNKYPLTPILRTIMRGDSLRLPPEIVKKMQLMFKAMLPVFEILKPELKDDRSNMVNFGFCSRTLVRLLGVDVFLPLFDRFRMEENEIRHSAFMRRMFAELDWVWEDGKIVDFPDSVLDELEAREAEEAQQPIEPIKKAKK